MSYETSNPMHEMDSRLDLGNKVMHIFILTNCEIVNSEVYKCRILKRILNPIKILWMTATFSHHIHYELLKMLPFLREERISHD
jgi:hypothetical protein